VDEYYQRWTKTALSDAEAAEMATVDGLAAALRAHLRAEAAAIATAHVHGAGSSAIQLIVSRLLAQELGFREEVVLTPQHGFVTRARPDFYYRLGPRRGVLAEVERGGTTTNNHDLKDFWKTHLAPDAQHLFLVVPVSNWNSAGAPRERPFALVARRLGAFFGEPRREVDVVSAHVFGYGGSAAVSHGPVRDG
jgi:hypothetical protein